jgi:hypothetical protein
VVQTTQSDVEPPSGAARRKRDVGFVRKRLKCLVLKLKYILQGKQEVMTATLEELYQLDSAFANAKIRVDFATKKASAIDVIRLVTGKDSRHAGEMLHRLGPDMVALCDQLRINGKGRETWVADATTLVEMIFDLPGKAAKTFRRQSANFICRLLGGDRTLIDEIEMRFDRTPDETKEFFLANAERTELPDRTEEEVRRVRKRKLEDLEICERQLALKTGTVALKTSTLNLNRAIMDLFGDDCQIQAAARDNIKNLVISDDRTIEHKTQEEFLPDFTSIVYELSGKTLKNQELSNLGKKVSKAFETKYGHKTKNKTMRFCHGANVLVNAYTERDRELVYGAIESYLK